MFNLRILKIRSSSCQCSMTSNGQRKEIQKYVVQIPNKDSHKDTGHSSVLETKRSTEISAVSEGKWDFTVTQMLERSKETGHPVFRSISALCRGILKRESNRYFTHVNADASNTELLLRTIHSTNQLSIYGPVVCWSKEFGLKFDETSERCSKTENEKIMKEVRPQEVNSLVQTPRSDDPVSGNRSRECLQNFVTLEKEIQFTKVYEDASFQKRVSFGSSRRWWFWRSNFEHAESIHSLELIQIPEFMS